MLLLKDLTENEVERAVDAVSAMRVPNDKDWKVSLAKGNVNVWIALFLSKLHKLEDLEADFGLMQIPQFLGQTLKHAAGCKKATEHVSRFQKLRKVSYCPNGLVQSEEEGGTPAG